MAEETYKYLDHEKRLPDEQKGRKGESHGTEGHLLINKTILKDYRKRHINVSMALIDYKKAYNFVPNSWIIKCIKVFGITENGRIFLGRSIKQLKLPLILNGKDLVGVDMNGGIFQGDSLSPLLFVLSTSLVLRNVNVCSEWGKKEHKLNHLLFVYELKLFSRRETLLGLFMSLVQIWGWNLD